MGDNHKNLLLCQRPLLQVISIVDNTLAAVKEFGSEGGMKFLTDTPQRENTKVPKPLTMNMVIDGPNSSLFPLPAMPSLSQGLTQLTEEDDLALKANEEVFMNTMLSYQEQVSSIFSRFFQSVSQSLGDVEDYLAFLCDLYSHVDASLHRLHWPTTGRDSVTIPLNENPSDAIQHKILSHQTG